MAHDSLAPGQASIDNTHVFLLRQPLANFCNTDNGILGFATWV
jgi:hypothetical protein